MEQNKADRIIELTKKIQQGRSEINTITETIRAEGRNSTEEEREKMKKIMDDVSTWSDELRLAKDLVILDDKLNNVQRDPLPPGLSDTDDTGIPGMPTKDLRFKTLGEQLMAVARATPSNPNYSLDRRLQVRSTGSNETTPSDGGFLVQADYAQEIIRRAYTGSPLVSRARRLRLTTPANSMKINAIDESDRSSSVWGGIILYWIGEGTEKTDTKPKFRQMEINLKKLAGLYYATDELLQDAAALATLANEGFSEGMNLELERVILRGTGAGQPLGVLNSPALISVSQEAYQGAGSIVFENLVKMYARLWAGSLPNAIWTISQSCIPELLQMNTSTSPSSGYAGAPVWMRDNNISGAPYGTIFGLPVFPVENASAVGTVGDIMLLDLNQYLLADKGGTQMASSIHVNFIYDETCYRWVYRCDGQPTWNAALTPKNGGDTQSPFIAMATRT